MYWYYPIVLIRMGCVIGVDSFEREVFIIEYEKDYKNSLRQYLLDDLPLKYLLEDTTTLTIYGPTLMRNSVGEKVIMYWKKK